ncbi:yteA family sporulation protein [Metabacillus malikii]|uniref:YteA family regulatory protein n=1 Tax=Metabacillus malikii TaxID=1504265 RepID=A0ABT9ZFN9_9BACI|nr:yteA family sporulation protein [Metabacillus malikii]MDQ0231101.1 YteA family regulatory protein [Metabacillus malikii]
MLSSQQVETFRSQLESMKNELNERFDMNAHFGLDAGHFHESMGELSSYDNHPGDEATELYEREKDIALNEHAEEELNDINRALKAIDEGTYGKCEVCGAEIPLERLDAIPTATTCVNHAPEEVVSHNRPVEEGVLMPPFGKFNFDDKDENVAFDAEDAYQIVNSYGSSETPSDLSYPKDHYNDVYMESEEPDGYVEDFENFIGTDMEGKEITVYPSNQHEKYEDELDEEGLMTAFGDLPGYEKDPYTEREHD